MRAWILFFILTGSTAFAQSVVVVESKSNEPLAYVTVRALNGDIVVVSDSAGVVDLNQFEIKNLVEIRRQGYQTMILRYSELITRDTLQLLASTVNLREVTISANRWEQSAESLPVHVSSVNAEVIDAFQPQSMADALGVSGEVFIQKSQQGGGSPMIRGFSANRLLYVVDGVRMNNAIFRGGNLHQVISLDPFTMDRLEVIMGPGSVNYGSDALGGVMSFHTLPVNFSEKKGVSGKTNFRYSSANNENTYHTDLQYQSRKLAWTGSFSYSNFGNVRMGTQGPESYLVEEFVDISDGQDTILNNPEPRLQVNTAYRQWFLMQKLRWEPVQNLNFQYSLYFSNTSDIPRTDRYIQRRNGQLRFARWDYGPQRWIMHNFAMEWNKQNILFDQMQLRLAYQSFDEIRIVRNVFDDETTTNSEVVQAYSTNLDFLKSLGRETILNYGMELIYNDVLSEGTASIGDSTFEVASRYPDAGWTSASAFGTLNHSLSDRWSLQLGARYAWQNLEGDLSGNLPYYPLPFSEIQNTNDALTGSAGVVYSPTHRLNIKSNLSTGFRAPNVDDVGKIFDSAPSIVVVPNADLTSEYVYSADISVKQSWNNLTLEGSAYFTYMDNAMVRRPFTLNGNDTLEYLGVPSRVNAIQNAAYARISGFYAAVSWQVLPFLGIVSKYNWQRGEEVTDDGQISPIRHAAPPFGMTTITLTQDDFEIRIVSQYNQEVTNERMPVSELDKPHIYATDQNGDLYSPAWMTFSLLGKYDYEEWIDFQLQLENITNQRYRSYSSGVVAPGFNARAVISVYF